jgi:hypothetical protein
MFVYLQLSMRRENRFDKRFLLSVKQKYNPESKQTHGS